MLTSKQIATLVGGKLSGNNQHPVENLLTDSRTYFVPENSVFFAISGNNHNGHQYIGELYNKGVRVFVAEQHTEFEAQPDADYIYVHSSVKALQLLATAHRNTLQTSVIAITGSNGKTTIKEWLYEIISQQTETAKSPRSYNSQLGVPLSVWSISNKHQYAIIEAGISKPNEMNKLQPIIRPRLGIFSNIGDAHQENFDSIEQKIDEKLLLFSTSEAIIYCSDNVLVHQKISAFAQTRNINKISWGSATTNFLQVIHIQKQTNNSILKLGQNNHAHFEIKVPFTSDALIENSLHTICTALYLNVDLHIIKQVVANIKPLAMRLEFQEAINQCVVLNDSYNADLKSLEIALNQLFAHSHNLQKTLILSDFNEIGVADNILYRQINALIAQANIGKFIAIGPKISRFHSVFDIANKHFFDTTAHFLANFNRADFQREAILLKGARSFAFENIERQLRKKSHTTTLTINLEAMMHNLNFFRQRIKPTTKLLVMVKAFAYGSGTEQIAQWLEHHGVEYLGVAFTDEGVALRQAGIKLPILVLNPDTESYYEVIKYGLEPEIYKSENLVSFARMAEKYATAAYPIHIKIDTGMHRLGFEHDNINELISLLKQNNHLRVQSIFSHLVASEDSTEDDFTGLQIRWFKQASDSIMQQLPYPILRHILNSSGIERHNNAQFDMVRLGIGLYGIASENQEQLKHISRLATRISQIKIVKAGHTVGYNRKGKITRHSRIATIPIGYADGLPRSLSNGNGKLWVNGTLCPIVGNVCMDMCMIDVSKTDALEGDEVVIFGQEYPVSFIAKQANTIPYEIFTGISQRVKRQYFQ